MKRGGSKRRSVYFLSSLESLDLVRAAAFLWIRCRFTALSSALVAVVMDFCVGDFLAFFTKDFRAALFFVFCLVIARS